MTLLKIRIVHVVVQLSAFSNLILFKCCATRPAVFTPLDPPVLFLLWSSSFFPSLLLFVLFLRCSHGTTSHTQTEDTSSVNSTYRVRT